MALAESTYYRTRTFGWIYHLWLEISSLIWPRTSGGQEQEDRPGAQGTRLWVEGS
jgi:hypothetical protein